MSEMPDVSLYQQIVDAYEREGKVAAVVKALHVAAAKVRRVLITEGLWSSPTSRKIAALLDEGLKKEEIAERLQCSVHAVEFYLPYKRGAYGLGQQSNTAQRIEDYRKRKAQASSSQVFHNDNYCETHNSSQMPKGQTTPIKKQREQRSRYESGCFRSGGNRYIVA